MSRSIPERTIYSLVNYIHEKSYFGDSLISFQITVYKKCFVWKARLVDLAGHMSIVRRIRNWKLNRQKNFFSKSVINKVFLTTPAFELSLFGKILHIGYPYCTDNSFYSFQDRKLFFTDRLCIYQRCAYFLTYVCKLSCLTKLKFIGTMLKKVAMTA